MESTSPPLFCDAPLARRIERSEIDLISAVNRAARERWPGGFLTRVAGGVASFADHGSPYNMVVGLGFDGTPARDVLDLVEHGYAAHGAATQVKLAHLADPQVGEMLTTRGHRLESFENVLGRSVAAPDAPTPAGLEIRPSPDDEFEEWLAVMATPCHTPTPKACPGTRSSHARPMRGDP